MVQHLFDHLLPRGQEKRKPPAQSLDGLLESPRFRPRAARADPGRSARRAHRPGAESPAGEQPDRRRRAGDLLDATRGLPRHYRETGMDALAAGMVAVVSLAGGVGSRWTKGAGVVKALNPFCKLGGRHRSFVEVHLAKSLRVGRAVRRDAAAHPHHQLPDPRRDRGASAGERNITAIRACCCFRRAASSACGCKNLQRFRVRTPTFANLPAMLKVLPGCDLADVPMIVLTIDPCISCTER